MTIPRSRPAPSRGRAASAPGLSASVVLVLIALAGCERRADSSAERFIRPANLTTLAGMQPAAVERLLGPPDDRKPDGSLIYRPVRIGRSGIETLTIRFTDGVVARICRSSP